MKKFSAIAIILILGVSVNQKTSAALVPPNEIEVLGPICGTPMYVEGTINVDTTWTTSHIYVLPGGYFPYSEVIVSAGVVLTIEPGVVIKFKEKPFGLVIDGKIIANGTEQNPIYFTSYKDDTLCGDTNGDGYATTPSSGDWEGITFNYGSDDSSSIQQAVIRYSGYYQGPVILDKVVPILENITFASNTFNGVRIAGGNWPSVSLNSTSVIYFIGDGINILPGHKLEIAPGVKIKLGSQFGNNAIYVSGQLKAEGTQDSPIIFTSLKDDWVCGIGAAGETICDTNNDGYDSLPNASDWEAIIFNTGSDESSIIKYTIIRYGGNGSSINLVSSNAPIVLDRVSPTLDNISFQNNSANVVQLLSGNWPTSSLNSTTVIYKIGDITIAPQHVFTIKPGVKIKFGGWQGYYNLLIVGKLVANGTQQDTIAFTSMKDDSICGIGVYGEAICDSNNDGSYSLPGPGDWESIEFNFDSDPSSIIQWAYVRYGGQFYEGGIHINGVSPTISYTVFDSNLRGLKLESGANPTLICNDFIYNDDFSMYNSQTSSIVLAEGQWWGYTSGPHHPTLNPTGEGIRVSDGIDFIPWSSFSCVQPLYKDFHKDFLPLVIKNP